MASEINKDKEVLSRRQNKLKDVDAPLKDQIPAKLKKKLEKLNVAQKVETLWRTGNANRNEWLLKQQEFLQDWDEFLVASDDGPFEGSSNLHLPVPLIVAKTLHARFLQALLAVDPAFTVKARNPASIERQQIIEDVMNYALKDWANKFDGIDAVLDRWLWDWITTGMGVLKQRWEVEYTRFMDVETSIQAGPPRFEVDDEGNEIAIPTTEEVEEEVEVTRKIFEGPVFEDVRVEDFLVIGGGGDPQKGDAVIQRSYLTASQLWTLSDRKIFDEKAVKTIIEGGPDHQIGDVADNIKQQRAENAGQADVDTRIDLDRYEILETYMKLDVDGSGINSEIITWTHNKSKAVLRGTYLYRVNKSGLRPFSKIVFHRRNEHEDMPIGLIEMMHPLSVEMDAMHNMRIDAGIMSNMPFGFYRPTSSIDPEVLELRPGALIPVDNPQTDIAFPNLGNRTAFGMQEEAALQTLIERLTSVSDINLGVLSSQQGAARTATGARALLGENSANLDVHLRRLNMGWKHALKYLLSNLQQRIPEGLSFRLTGDDGNDYWRQIKSQDDIAGQFDFEVAPNTANSNKQIQIQNADTVAQIQNNPLLIQLGVVTPLHLYEGAKMQLSTRGFKDVSRVLQKPPQQRIFSPEEEVNRILRGIPTPVTPEGDHEGYLSFFEEIRNNDEILSLYLQQDPDALNKLAAQAQQHAQMLQALEQLQAQQRNLQQARTNQGGNQARSEPGQNVGGPEDGAV